MKRDFLDSENLSILDEAERNCATPPVSPAQPDRFQKDPFPPNWDPPIDTHSPAWDRTPLQRWMRLGLAVVVLILVLFASQSVWKIVSAGLDSLSTGQSDKPKPASDEDLSYADFSNPQIDTRDMNVTPSSGFAFNNAFPKMFGGTWRITALSGGFRGTFSVPSDGRYDLVVTHGSSYDDGHRRDGYSPVTIRVNSKVVVSNYSPPALKGAMPTDRWQIVARAGKNTFEWTLVGGATTHYWIQRIEIVPSS
jgi:hypothetical protein